MLIGDDVVTTLLSLRLFKCCQVRIVFEPKNGRCFFFRSIPDRQTSRNMPLFPLISCLMNHCKNRKNVFVSAGVRQKKSFSVFFAKQGWTGCASAFFISP